MRGEVYKDYYPLPIKFRKSLIERESKEDIEAYFEYLQESIDDMWCSECKEEIIIDETWSKDEIKERTISGMCKKCQLKVFGI